MRQRGGHIARMPQAAAPTPQATRRDVHDLPVQVRAATLEPATFNEADNTVEIVWTQGATVRLCTGKALPARTCRQ